MRQVQEENERARKIVEVDVPERKTRPRTGGEQNLADGCKPGRWAPKVQKVGIPRALQRNSRSPPLWPVVGRRQISTIAWHATLVDALTAVRRMTCVRKVACQGLGTQLGLARNSASSGGLIGISLQSRIPLTAGL